MSEPMEPREARAVTIAPASRPWGQLRAALAWGLVAGWLNLGLVLAQRTLDPTVTMASLRTNRQYLWMIPLSDILFFATVGVVVALLERFRPRLAQFAAWRLYAGLAALALALDLEGLHRIAVVTVAVGVGVRLGPVMEKLAGRYRRSFRGVLAVAAVGLAVLGVMNYVAVATAERRALAALPTAAPGARNVVVIVLDNVRASSLSLYGNQRPTSPNLERLARDGVTFTQARSTSSWTLAAHASLFTGRWCHELSFDFDRPLDSTHPTLAEALARRGYATAGFVGNTFYGNARYGLNRGFASYEDHHENEAITLFEIVRSSGLGKALLAACRVPIRDDQGASERKTAAMINRDALAWLDTRPRDRPFFVFLNYFDAHTPFIPPDGPDPRFGLAALPYDERARIVMRELGFLTNPAAADASGADRIRREAAAVRLDSYESCIAYLDRQIGLLFDELDRRGLRDDTLIVVTSDHGEHFAERGFSGHGLSLYKPEVHVPLLILPPSPPAGISGRTIDAPVSLRDTAATVVDLLDCSEQEPFPGQSLARYWRPGATRTDAPLLAELGGRDDLIPNPQIPTSLGTLKAMMDRDFLYIRNGDGREELYHVVDDPLEVRNLVAEPNHGAAVARLRRKMEALSRPPEAERLTGSAEPQPLGSNALED
jgi:arylsulfatase A-like enzyme